MMRYFFDVRYKASIEYDYKGRMLASLEHAQQRAELIALDLACISPDLSGNAEVQIRGAEWNLLATCAVNSDKALAA